MRVVAAATAEFLPGCAQKAKVNESDDWLVAGTIQLQIFCLIILMRRGARWSKGKPPKLRKANRKEQPEPHWISVAQVVLKIGTPLDGLFCRSGSKSHR